MPTYHIEVPYLTRLTFTYEADSPEEALEKWENDDNRQEDDEEWCGPLESCSETALEKTKIKEV